MSGPADGTIEPVYAEVGRRVRKARLRGKLTQAALAARTSLSRTSIANIERGEQRFMFHCLFELAVALAVPPGKLLPADSTEPSIRAQVALDGVEDKAAAKFIESGLRKTKVISHADNTT